MDVVDSNPTGPERLGRLFHGASGWLVSAICHLSAVLLLLMLSLPDGTQPSEPLMVTMDTTGQSPQPQFTLVAEEPAVEPLAAPSVAEVPDPLALVADAKVAEVVNPSTSHFVLASMGGAPLDTPVGSSRGRAGDAMFFGTSASGRDFIFILDCSGSMIARNGERFARARDELVNSISRLRRDQRFYVYLFNWSTIPMFGPESDPGTLIAPTEENETRLRTWLYSIRPRSGTDPRAALMRSFQMAPDAIFLLSDGQFNTAHPDPLARLGFRGTTVFDIAARENQARVQINTIAFEDVVAATGMSRLAKQSDGQFRFVPAPGQDAGRWR